MLYLGFVWALFGRMPGLEDRIGEHPPPATRCAVFRRHGVSVHLQKRAAGRRMRGPLTGSLTDRMSGLLFSGPIVAFAASLLSLNIPL